MDKEYGPIRLSLCLGLRLRVVGGQGVRSNLPVFCVCGFVLLVDKEYGPICLSLFIVGEQGIPRQNTSIDYTIPCGATVWHDSPFGVSKRLSNSAASACRLKAALNRHAPHTWRFMRLSLSMRERSPWVPLCLCLWLSVIVGPIRLCPHLWLCATAGPRGTRCC